MRADPHWPAARGLWCPALPAPSTSSPAPKLPSPYFPVAAQTIGGRLNPRELIRESVVTRAFILITTP